MKNTFTLLLTMVSILTFAQKATLEWVKTGGNNNVVIASGNTIDENGDVYTVGMFEGTLDFNPDTVAVHNLTSNGGKDIFIQKLTANGQFVWAYNLGGSQDDQGINIHANQNNAIYITGYFKDSLDFDPSANTFYLKNVKSFGSYANSYTDGFVLKLSLNGQFQWVKQLEGILLNSAVWPKSLTTNNNGNLSINGTFSGAMDINPGAAADTITAHNIAGFIVTLDSSGNKLWHNHSDNNNYLEYTQVAFDNNYLYNVGFFSDSITVFSSNSSITYNATSANTSFIQKIDSLGNTIWLKAVDGTGECFAHSMTIDHLSNIIIGGWFKGTIDFDPSTNTQNRSTNFYKDLFLLKINDLGDFVWHRQFVASSSTIVSTIHSVAVDMSNNIYATGTFKGTFDFDPDSGVVNLTSINNIDRDLFYLNLNENGGFEKANNISGHGYWSSVKVNPLHTGVFISGDFRGLVDFDPGVGIHSKNSLTEQDFFVLKYGQCQKDSTQMTIHSCKSYTWIDGKVYNASTNTPTFVLSNKTGCDSIVTLNLTITRDSVVQTIQTCNDFTWIDGITYSSSNFNASYLLTTSKGCDSVVYLNLTIDTVDNRVLQNGITIMSLANSATYQWLDCNTMQPIVGETNQSFTPSHNGDYAVIVTENGCTDTSACYSINNIGLEEWNTSKLKVYPNPSEGHFTVELNETLDGNLEIYSLSGQMVYQQKVNGQPLVKLNLEITKGVYVLKISSQAQNLAQRLIIQ